MRTTEGVLLLQVLTGLTLAFQVAAPAEAAAPDRPNVVRGGLAYVVPTGDLTTDGFFVAPVDPDTRIEFSGDLILEPQEQLGGWVEYERRFTDRIGLDVALLATGHDVDGTLRGTLRLIDNATNDILEETPVAETEKVADIDFTPLFVGANFHLTPGRSFDVYLGPFVAWVTYGDLELGDESISIDDDFGLGAVVGIDLPVGRGRWNFSGALRYLQTEADPGSGPDDRPLDVNPWIVQAGVGYRF